MSGRNSNPEHLFLTIFYPTSQLRCLINSTSPSTWLEITSLTYTQALYGKGRKKMWLVFLLNFYYPPPPHQSSVGVEPVWNVLLHWFTQSWVFLKLQVNSLLTCDTIKGTPCQWEALTGLLSEDTVLRSFSSIKWGHHHPPHWVVITYYFFICF